MSASDPHRAALDQLADAVLGTVEQVVDPGGERLESTVNSLRRLMIEFVRRYKPAPDRLSTQVPSPNRCSSSPTTVSGAFSTSTFWRSARSWRISAGGVGSRS